MAETRDSEALRTRDEALKRATAADRERQAAQIALRAESEKPFMQKGVDISILTLYL